MYIKILLLLFFCLSLFSSGKYIGLLVKTDYRGEISFAYRIQAACKNIHWKADIIDTKNPESLYANNYDFVITLVPGRIRQTRCKNYLAIFDPIHHYFNENGFLCKRYCGYDGYLLSYTPFPCANKNTNFTPTGKYPYMLWYPTAQKTDYQIVHPSHLFHICCSWGNRFEDTKFQRLFHLLDQEPYTRFYGSPLFQTLYPNSYQKPIPYDEESLYKEAARAGIVLVLHSSDHNTRGIPSGRIFESAAASTVIICDQNAFVQKHFGDSVLYINTEEDEQSIFDQIQHHMHWIYENTAKALEKAKRAHAINQERFSLEHQLIRLEQFHNRLSKK